MNRIKVLENIQKKIGFSHYWRRLIGFGIAVDSASRGYKTLLIEKHDFSKGPLQEAPNLFTVV